jgi:hypothetical protein
MRVIHLNVVVTVLFGGECYYKYVLCEKERSMSVIGKEAELAV